MIVVLDWLQYFVETVGHVVANRWLVFPTILASLQHARELLSERMSNNIKCHG